MHISGQLIESFPLTYGSNSRAKEKLSIPLEAHDKAQSSKIFLSFQARNLKSCNFFIFWPILLELQIWASETESFPTIYGFLNRGEEKLQFTAFGGGPKPGCSDSIFAGLIESHNFFVLHRILVKFHIQTFLIESFPTTHRSWWCTEEKLHFTPVHTLCQLKRDEALIRPLRRVVEFRRGTVR